MTGVATQGGFSDRLRNPTDLLAKMRHDLDRLEADPSNDYAAFDYFIAAHHIEDWVRNSGGQRRGDSSTLEIVRELANLGKHFRRDRNATDRTIRQEGAFQADAFDPRAFQTVRLVLEVPPEGPRSAVAIARENYQFWASELGDGGAFICRSVCSQLARCHPATLGCSSTTSSPRSRTCFDQVHVNAKSRERAFDRSRSWKRRPPTRSGSPPTRSSINRFSRSSRVGIGGRSSPGSPVSSCRRRAPA